VTEQPKSEKTALWRFLAAIVIPILLLLGRYEIVGSGRIPKTGAFILAPNHVTNFDPLVSAYVLWRAGRVPRFLAKAGLFRVPVLGGILRATGQIPVERAGAVREGDPLSAASRLVDDGLAIIIYPEGTLTRDPDEWPMRGKLGAVRLALEHGIEIIPVGIWGAQRILPRYSKRVSLFPRKDVRVLIGEPISLAAWDDAPRTTATYVAATETVMNAITALVAKLRDEAPPESRWDPAEHGQTEFGKPE
jgi:1-acyl-sn-glycerol-3-phosphate acyltransferase